MAEYFDVDVEPFVLEKPLVCTRCGVTQLLSEVRTVEIVEPGRTPRTEFHGKIRAQWLDIFKELVYSCLVCGNTWQAPPEDPTPGGASITFLHPVLEGFEDRDAC